MKKYLFIALFSAFSLSVFSQWLMTNPSPTNLNLQNICLVNNQTGYAVGYGFSIFKTVNGGTNWSNCFQNIQISNNGNLYDVDFLNENTGLAVGEYGVILKTVDGGLNWTLSQQNENFSFSGVSFISSQIAFAVGSDEQFLYGGVILRTTDGGANWTSTLTDQNLNAVDFPSATVGYAVGRGGTILKTIDGGSNWTQLTSGFNGYLFDLVFVSETTGYVVGESGVILKTIDGGSSWQSVTPNSGITLYGIDVNPSGGLTAIGETGVKLYSSDNGANWTVQGGVGSLPFLAGISSTTDKTIAVGQNGAIMKTENYIAWQNLQIGPLFDIYAACSPSPGKLFAVAATTLAAGKILESSDTGKTWVSREIGSMYALDLDFLNNTTGYAVGMQGAIYKTVNGGLLWETQSSNTIRWLYGVDFVNENVGVAVGEWGEVVKTTNGGATWTVCNSTTLADLRDVYCKTDQIWFAVGEAGRIIKTTDAGTTWADVISNTELLLVAIHFVNENIGFMLNSYGGIIKTTDGGNTWTSVFAAENVFGDYFSDLYFENELIGYKIGQAGTVKKTTDGGLTWGTQSFPTFQFLNGIIPVDNKVMIVGNKGTVALTSNGGGTIVAVDDFHNVDYQDLHITHLYPNPTQQDLSIEYSLSTNAQTIISLYDYKGALISELQNQSQEAGTYKQTFSLDHLSNGLYFFKIEAITVNNVRSYTQKVVVIQ